MHATLALIFFLSGASALIFESLWFRLAGLSLGNSVWSASLVLAAFMGGLALGNGIVARLHQRIVRPVRLYAALEFAIGIGGFAVVLLLPRLPGLLGPSLGSLTEWPLLLNLVRLTIAFAILVTPAVAMGATLPVLAQALSRRDANFGANIGWLYGWNTCGAVLGALSAELLMVPLVGILSSGFVALSFNVLAGLIALRFSRSAEAASDARPRAPEEPLAVDSRVRRYIAVAFLSGALMLALEVVWFRYLLLTRDGSSLIFAVMLAVVLAGIAVGGLVAGYLFRRDEQAYRWLRHVSSLSAALVVLTYWGYDLFAVDHAEQDITMNAFVLFATFLMFPVAFLSGVAFTMVNRAVKNCFGPSSRTAGIVTFYNTIGAMAGSLCGGFLLLPLFGMELSFFIVAVAYFLLAFIVPQEEGIPRQTIILSRGAIAAAAASLVLFPFGLMRQTHFGTEIPWLPNHTLISTREGPVETIRYFRRELYGEPKYYRLVTNGHSMSATSVAAKRYMKLYVYLPLALKPDIRDALLISYGVGSTAKALTDSPGLENIDVVDISSDILEMSSIVYLGDDNPLLDNRVRVHIEDGRFFLNTTRNRYDLITAEPPPPKHAGVVNLYSHEYFELVRSRLNPGGYVTYWLPVQQLAPIEALAIIKAFCNAFQDCSLWSGAGLEWMLLGSNDADGRADAAQFSAQWREPGVAQELASLGLESPSQLGSLFMADAGLLIPLTADIAPVVDNYPLRISSRRVINQHAIELYDALMDENQRLERFRNSELIDTIWPVELRKESEQYFQYERLITNHFTGGTYRRQSDLFYWEVIDELLTHTSLTTLPLWLLGSDDHTHAIIVALTERDGYRDEFALHLARKHAALRDFETATHYANAHIRTANDASAWTSRFQLYLLAKSGKLEEARPIIAKLEKLGQPGFDRFLAWYTSKFEIVGSGAADASEMSVWPE